MKQHPHRAALFVRASAVIAAFGFAAFCGRASGQATQPADLPAPSKASAAAPSAADAEKTGGESGAVDQPTTQPVHRAEYDINKTKTLTGDWGGVRKELEDVGFKFELSYQQQFQQNFRGGLSTNNGHRFSGTYDMVMEFDFGKMKLIPGGSFYIKAKGGYSDGINPDKVGALGNVNSDAFQDYAIFVRKWWYRQTFFDEKIDIRVGRIQTNKDLFDVSLFANHEDKDFLNTFSVRNPTIPHATAIGVFARVQPVKWAYVQAATYDAQVVHRFKTGFDTAFHDDARWVGIWEAGLLPQFESAKGPMPGSFRIGTWYDPRVRPIFMKTLGGRLKQRFGDNQWGLYVGADQLVWKETDDPKDTQGLGVFARFGMAPEDKSRISYYWQAGASYKGLVPKRDRDVTGLSVSQAILSDDYREFIKERADRETIYEWYYQFQVYPWMTIAPNIQVITNPGGGKDDRDALVGGVRLRIIF